MTEREKDNILQRVREIATRIGQELAIKETMAAEEQEVLEEEKIQQQEEIMKIIQKGLEQYRGSEADSSIRKMINYLIKRHKNVAKVHSNQYRQRHNILVLKYMISSPIEDREIKKRLNVYGIEFEKQLNQGIQEIAELFLGILDNIY